VCKAIHGLAVLYDCHSIRSHIPFLFEGTLPDFNIGTNGGTTCAPDDREPRSRICAGRRGLHSTISTGASRAAGRRATMAAPPRAVHAIQMELAQSTYLA
jgi:N-formylglutamate deformylase